MNHAPDDPRHDAAKLTLAELRDVTVDLGGRRALDGMTVTLPTARIALIGSNGSGKSTFLRLVDGLVPASSGHVRVLGLDPAKDGKRLRRRVGFVFTNPDAQIVMPTVREDLAFSLRGLGWDRERVAETVSAWLRDYGLDGHADAPAQSLSGGQKQSLAIAAVLIRGPELLLADEPTTMLDLRNARRIADLLMEHRAGPLIVATHDLALAARCEIAIRFERGCVAQIGEPGAVIEAYRAACA